MASRDWDFGKHLDTTRFAPIKTDQDGVGDPVEEYFEVARYRKGVVVRAVRPFDLVDLRLAISGYACIGLGTEPGRQQRPRLARKRSTGKRMLLVGMPPQHIAEQIRAKPGPGGCETASGWGPSRVRMSAPSRLVFEIPDEADWGPHLRVSELTDWARLIPRVHPRARAGIGIDVVAQLLTAFPDKKPADFADISLEQAVAAIEASLTGPGESESALEMASRLILSPSEEGRWIVPRDEPDALAAPLWSARLDRAGRRSVRALWSTRMEPGRIPPNLDDPDNDAIANQPLLSLSFKSHWEIVAQTSVYGLPALRPLADADAAPAVSGAGDAEVGGEAVSAPRGGVVRPAFKVAYLDEIDAARSFRNKDSGIAIATPFDDADINLTALGGVFGAEWKGDPAGLLVEALPRGFDLERLSYRSWLGRDSRVVAVEKGFLFPLGVRASLVTVHERNIYPDANGDPVSYLVRRTFIVTPKRVRSYPGPYQPDAGREFPPKRIAMKTLVTPDLAPIANIVLGPPPGIALPPASLFWPQVSAGEGAQPADFLFEWSTEDAVAVQSRLLFVANSLVRDEAVMAALADHYNQAAEHRRTAWLGGARHRYAEMEKEGDTSFDTASWLMGAQGRRDGPGGAEHFAMDGRMEGADQPPFYPVMKRGRIAVQSIDQMMGAPQGQVAVEYFPDYVQNGFKTAKPHGIFLKLVDPVVRLPASARNDRSGGIASPDMLVAALSRKTGLIGGAPAAGSDAMARTGAGIDFGDAVDGRFNPAQFFQGAKLLGVVKLEDIVATALDLEANAPRLIEQVEYGAREALELVGRAAGLAHDALYGSGGLVARLDAAIVRADDLLVGEAFALADIYPSLMEALTPVRNGALRTALDALAGAADPTAASAPIAAILKIVRALLTAAAAVLKDPIPDKFEEIFAAVSDFFERLQNNADAAVGTFVQAMIGVFHDWLRTAFCDAVDQDGFGRILFGERGDLSCPELFDDPEAALRALGEGLYGEAFARVLAKTDGFATQAHDLAAEFDLATEKFRRSAITAADAGIRLIEDRLAPFDPAIDDIRLAARKAQLASEIVEDIEALVAPPAGLSPRAALAFARELAGRVRGQAEERIESHLDALLPAIRAAAGVDAQTLLDAFKAAAREHLKTALVDPLAGEAEALHRRLDAIVREIATDGFRTIFAQLSELFDAILASAEVTSIARAGRAIPAICADVQAAAITLSDGVMAASDAIAAEARLLIDAVARIAIPAGDQGAPLRDAVDRVTAAAEAVLLVNEQLRAERERIANAAPGLCENPAAWIDPIAALLRLRGEASGRLAEIARQAEAIAALFDAGAPSADDRRALGDAIRSCAELYLGLTGVAGLGDAADVSKLSAAAQRIVVGKIGPDAYLEEVDEALRQALGRAEALRTALGGALDPTTLRVLAEGPIGEFQRWFDRKIAAFLIQSVGFTDAILSALDTAVDGALKQLCALVLPIYGAVGAVLDAIAQVTPADPLLAAVYRYALGGAGKFDAIDKARASLADEEQRVRAIEQNPSIKAVRKLVRDYEGGAGALPEVIATVQGLALVDVGQNLTQALHEQLALIEEEARTLIRQFVPTRVQTRYAWNTALTQFPPSDEGWIFRMARSTDRDLVLESRFAFDIVSLKREAEIEGVLQPFELRLLGKKFHMATIKFGETRFRSVNGSSPSFAMKVEDVTIGPFLEYIQQLQQWLKPQGSGFYVRPAPGFAGIEAGYIYDAGIIQLGSLQFINVAFRVAAILPFSPDRNGKQDASFIFALAGPERPFLISSPPYGGGGWVVLTCNAERVTELDVALVFGGVAAIRFGPLDAQGRIVAGVRVQSMTADNGKKAYVFTAIFEAVGEGSIACFSISVSLRITLTQKTGGALYGQTTYRFTFKVGFARIRYSVSARYRLSGGGGDSGSREALAVTRAGTDVAIVRSNVPDKATQWRAYRRHFDLSLLEEAA